MEEKNKVVEQETPTEESKVDDGKERRKKKRSIGNIILNIAAILLFLFVLFETVIAFLNFNQIKNKKEPSYFTIKNEEKIGEYKYTIYDMGLYKIVRKDGPENYEIKLLPFFLDNDFS